MSTIADKRISGGQAASDFLNSLGDLKGFGTSMLQNVVIVLVIGYVGSTVVSITQLPWKVIDDLFPTDINGFPYEVPQGKSDPPSAKVEDIMKGYDPNNAESLTRGVMEYIFPLKRRSFPYSSWFLSEAFQGSKGFIVAKWFSMSCANAFCVWRKLYVMLILLGQWMHKMLGWVADLLLFYAYPYFIFYLILLPIIPIVGYLLACAGSVMYNVPMAWVFTFAPLMGIMLAIANLFSGGIFNIFSWIMSFLLGWAGLALGFVNVAWWAAIGIALWLYSVVFLFLAPLLYDKGLSRLFGEIKRHTRSLLTLFLILMVMSAFKTLSTKLSIGITIGAVICAVLIFFNVNKTPKPAPAP